MHVFTVANKLGALATALQDLMLEDMAGAGQSASAALVTVLHREPITIGGLAEIVGLSHAATVRVADRLERAGRVRRKKMGGREVHLVLTARGKKRATAIQAARLEKLSAALNLLPGEEIERFDHAVSLILGALVRDRSHARRLCRLCDHSICSAKSCPAGNAAARIELESHDH